MSMQILFPSSVYAESATADAISSTNDILLGEIAWAGSTLSTADEWLELWNTSSSEVSLEGYILTGASASPIIFTSEHKIPALSTLLISNYDASDSKSTIATSTPYVTTAVSLSNSDLHITLQNPQGQIISETAIGTPQAGSSSPKASMIWLDHSWVSATTTFNLKEGISDFGTPGFCDGCTIEVPLSTIEELEDALSTSTEEVIDISIVDELAESDEALLQEEMVISETVSTSTQAEIPIPQTTSTEEIVTDMLIETLPVTSTTETIPIIQEVTSTETIPTSTEPVMNEVSTSLPITTIEPPSIELWNIYPAPLTGEKEHIALRWTSTEKELSRLDGWYLKNGRDRVFLRISTSTRERMTLEDDVLTILLTSSYLLNSGDTVILFDASSTERDRMSYTETTRGVTWQRDGESWKNDLPLSIETTPTSTVITVTTTATHPIVHSTSTKHSAPIISPKPKKASIIMPARDTSAASSTKTTNAKAEKTASKKAPSQKAKATVRKTSSSSKKPIEPIHDTTIDTLLMNPLPLRVRLSGVVGTVPGILKKRQLILHSPDGRGLLVQLRTGQKTPPQGSHITITGSIIDDDDGVRLVMKSIDTLKITSNNTPLPLPRAIDLLAEETEDTWSRISVTGTILAISGTKIDLDVDGIHLSATIKPATRYRVKRLQKKDLLHITGVVNFESDGPMLYPIITDDIHVTKIQATEQIKKATLPNWLPFGAAGITMATYEGFKRLRKRKTLLIQST